MKKKNAKSDAVIQLASNNNAQIRISNRIKLESWDCFNSLFFFLEFENQFRSTFNTIECIFPFFCSLS